jgi:hypothetical protein
VRHMSNPRYLTRLADICEICNRYLRLYAEPLLTLTWSTGYGCPIRQAQGRE